MKKYIVSILVASVFLIGTPFLVPKVLAADLNIRDFINLLVAIGVIPPDRMPAVNAYLATLDNTATPVTPVNEKTLYFSTTFVGYSYIIGDTIPSDYNHQQIILTNGSKSNINIKISVKNQPSWLNTGYSTDTLTINPGQPMGIGVSANPAGLSAGTYKTDIKISGNFDNSPRIIPVTLRVFDNNQQPTPVTPATSTKVTVISPNGGEKYTTNSIVNIRWDGPAGYYNILLTDKNGFGKGTIAKSVYTGFGKFSYQWNVHNLSMESDRGDIYMDTVPGEYKILIVSEKVDNVVGYSISDSSNNSFKIVSDVATPVVPPVVTPVTQPTIKVTYPNGGEKLTKGGTYTIKWDASNVPDKAVDVVLLNLQGQRVEFISNPSVFEEKYNWNIPSNISDGNYILRVEESTNGLAKWGDSSDSYFTITSSTTPPVVAEPSITSLSASSGLPGTLISVFGRNLYNSSSPYNVTFNDPTHDNGVPGSAMTNGSTLTFAVPRLPAGSYTITLENTQGIRSNTVSFTITAPDSQSSVTVTSPNGGEVFNSGDIHRIEWSAPSSITSVAIMLKDSNGTGDWIQFSMPNTGYYDWAVKKWNTVNTQFEVFIIGYPAGSTGNPVDSSDNYFTIN